MSKWVSSAIVVLAAIVTASLIFLTFESDAQTPAKQAPAKQTPAAKQPAAAPPAPPTGPQRTESFVQDSWTVNCQEMAGAKKTCSATLQVVDGEKRQVLFGWVIGKTADGVLTGVFQTPTGVLIQRGIELKIGNAAPRKVNFVNCTSQRCEATFPLDDALIREISASAAEVASIFLVDGRTVNYNINSKGFDKAVAAIGR